MKEVSEAATPCRRLRKKTTVPGLPHGSILERMQEDPFLSLRKTTTTGVKPHVTKPVAPPKAKGGAKSALRDDMRRGRFVLKEVTPHYAVIKSALSKEDLQRLDEFLKLQTPEPARMKNEGEGEDDHERKVDYNDRDCKVFWFHLRNDCPWLQKHFADMLRDVGNVEFPLLRVSNSTGNVLCEWEQTQYTVYGPGQHFNCWHQDAYADGHDQEDARQLALVAMLTKKAAYTDGAFEMKLPAPSGRKNKFLRKSIRLDAGDVIIFPAKELIHRVRPVKKGTRRTLVFWANDRKSCHFYNPKLKTQKRISKF